MKLILKARKIPIGSIITKNNGTKKYVLRSEIRVYDQQNKVHEFRTQKAKILMSETGDANLIGDDIKLYWISDEATYFNFLNLRRMGRSK